MKKQIIGAAILGCALLLSGCSSLTPAKPQDSADPSATPADTAAVKPLESTLKMDELDNSSFAAGFEAKDVYLNDDGALVIDLTVYNYEQFDLVDISALKEGDTIVLGGKDVLIDTLERDANGFISINGGLEEGGYWLGTEDSGVYYQVLEDDARSYFEVGKITLPVAQDFVFTDNSDPENQGKTMLAGDFLTEIPKSDEVFSPRAVTVTVKDGYITAVDRVFVP